MNLLNKQTYASLNKKYSTQQNNAYPVKVLQFGEGNFLRAFIDYFIDELNDRGLFGGSICVVQGLPQGHTEVLSQQDQLYTVVSRGLEDGNEREIVKIVTSIKASINPYEDFAAYFKQAENPDLRFVFSNTTEAGIVYSPEELLAEKLHASFPAKLTYFLWKRFEYFKGANDKGLIFFPCELIDNNGQKLKEIVLRLAKDWDLPATFVDWVCNHNTFNNTLVDRIVTGFPSDSFQALSKRLGYVDNMLDTSELFHFFVVEGPAFVKEEIPFDKAGLHVLWTQDASPYKNRKVRILNGGHTCMVLGAFLAGNQYVGEAVGTPLWNTYLKTAIFEEIIPALSSKFVFHQNELESFANAVFDRFANPYIKHALLSIAFNSVSKINERVLPSIADFYACSGTLPKILTFAFACFIQFYRICGIDNTGYYAFRGTEKYYVKDEQKHLDYFYDTWKNKTTNEAVNTICCNGDLWDTELSSIQGFISTVSAHICAIEKKGVKSAAEALLHS